ncbi:MAG TPA: isochorismatase family cysteine hydrolase [Candidatus Limnocylindrales bacterium]|nr:isochorismatase family cysteine hydrolase [Candidatus Limnocylindrales bacterium]
MKALLIVDMVVDFIDKKGALYIGPGAEDVVLAIKSRLDEYRSAGELVIFLCDRHVYDDQEFTMFPPHSLEGTEGSEIVPELAPLPGERIIYKRRFSAFFGTDLDLTLREKGISDLELVGVVTNICILYTAAQARMLSYRVTVPIDAVTSFDQDAHRFALQEMGKTLGVTLI